ncbi:MAG: prepilin-type N-terminal cleavage/methylation domain-containing protein [Verrucomicrobiales bacterium]|nr:prepilin-type N-terminal cleavage/methylation domain-containing protein [Verrucomicrobiales bacterium]
MTTQANPFRRAIVRARQRAGGRRVERGFTMVEIAICIAVVAFAMVAIIGVLPTGFQVQKDNREDTLINQEGLLWLEAIRSGARGMDYLTNHVEVLQRTEQSGATTRTLVYRYGARTVEQGGYSTGLEIVGLLTQPKYQRDANNQWVMRRSQAVVRAVGGSAVDKTPGNEFAFTYLLSVEAVPFSPYPPALTNFNDTSISPEQQQIRQQNYLVAENMTENTHELRLTIEWPARVTGPANQPQLGVTGTGRKVFRVLSSGYLEALSAGSRQPDLHWTQPAEFRIAQ